MLSPNTVSDYRERGYCVLKAVIEPIVIAEIKSEIQSIFTPLLQRHQITDGSVVDRDFDSALGELFRRDMNGFLAAAKATQLSPKLHNLGSSESMIRLVKKFGLSQPIIAVRPVVHILSDELQVPQGYHRTPAHQDWRSVQGSVDAIVVWLPLVEVNAAFGPLEIWPGSHRLGLFETRPDPFGNVVVEAELEEDKLVPVSVDPGDAIAFSMFTVHRTGKEQSPGIRWAISFRYNNAADEDFIEHGYPNPFVYQSEGELLVKNYPTLQDVQRVFGSD